MMVKPFLETRFSPLAVGIDGQVNPLRYPEGFRIAFLFFKKLPDQAILADELVDGGGAGADETVAIPGGAF